MSENIVLDVYDLGNEIVGKLEVSAHVLNKDKRVDILHTVVKYQRAKKRQGTHSTKSVAEVKGSNKKMPRIPGHARKGTRKDPQFVGGGIVWGPKPRSYEFKISKKMKKLGIMTAISARHDEKKLLIVDNFSCNEISTKKINQILNKLMIDSSALFVYSPDMDCKNFKLSVRNLPKKKFILDCAINVYDILNHEHLIITKDAMKNIENKLVDKDD